MNPSKPGSKHTVIVTYLGALTGVLWGNNATLMFARLGQVTQVRGYKYEGYTHAGSQNQALKESSKHIKELKRQLRSLARKGQWQPLSVALREWNLGCREFRIGQIGEAVLII